MFCSFFEFMMRSLLSLVFGDLNRWCTRDDYFTTSDLWQWWGFHWRRVSSKHQKTVHFHQFSSIVPEKVFPSIVFHSFSILFYPLHPISHATRQGLSIPAGRQRVARARAAWGVAEEVAQLHAEDLRGAGDCSWEKSSRKWEYPWEKLQETGDFHQVIQWFSPKMVDFVVISWEIMEICYLKIVGKPYRFHVFFSSQPPVLIFQFTTPQKPEVVSGIWRYLEASRGFSPNHLTHNGGTTYRTHFEPI